MKDASEATSNGRHARDEGHFSKAREYYADAASIYREQNDLLAYAHSIRHIADIYQQEGNRTGAKPLYEEALKLYRGNLHTKLLDLANTVRPYAHLTEQEGRLDLARPLWQEARNLYGSLGVDAGVSECDSHIAKFQRSLERAVPILPAGDLSLAKVFYVDGLGFRVTFEVSEDGQSGLLGLERGTIQLTLDSPMEGHGRNACVSLHVDDADAYYRDWSAKVAILRPPRDEVWGARTFDLLDPAGNTLFVMGPLRDSEQRFS